MTGLEEEPVGRPMYDLLSDPLAVVQTIDMLGGEEFDRRIKEEIRQAMEEVGVGVVLWYGEKMGDVTARLEEFAT